MKTEAYRQAQWRYDNQMPPEDDGLAEWLSEQDEDVLLQIREDRPDLRDRIDVELYTRDSED